MSLKMIFLAFGGSLFPVILFNIDRKKIFFAGISGMLGWIAYSLTLEKTGSPIVSSFFGATAVNMYSELMARIIKAPASTLYIPGIFPLVPGFIAYDAIIFLVEKNYAAAQDYGIQVLEIAGSIGFGMMLSSSVIQYIFKYIKAHEAVQTD